MRGFFVRRKAALACLIAAAAVALACAFAAAPAGAAWGADDENMINPQQRPDSSFIYDTSIAALSSADTFYDNQTVQVVGEVVGDAINAVPDGSYKWIDVAAEDRDSSASVAVYLTSSAASRIDTFGRYGTTGTMLQVRGTFHLVCPEHDGTTDIHADVVSVVDSGENHPDSFHAEAFVPGAVAVVAGVVLMFVFYRLRERQR